MKKYLILILLFFSINSYSQADSTKVWEARKEWVNKTQNLNEIPPMPNWDLDGNIIPIVGILFISFSFVGKLTQIPYQSTQIEPHVLQIERTRVFEKVHQHQRLDSLLLNPKLFLPLLSGFV